MEVYQKKKSITVFKHGETEGKIEVTYSISVGVFVYANAYMEALVVKNDEIYRISRESISKDIRTKDDLIEFENKTKEKIESLKSELEDRENKIIMIENLINSM